MDDKRLVRTSKYLSKYLRHEPEALGLTLAPGGWVAVDDLLAASARNGFQISRAELDEVVARNNKQRFSFDPTGMLIRANQGHSVDVDLQLQPTTPPDTLYHGTARHIADTIAQVGLKRMQRHHVHLSADIPTAHTVGARHGHPVVFEVDAARMVSHGYEFYRSENGVWLVDSVPQEYLRILAHISHPEFF